MKKLKGFASGLVMGLLVSVVTLSGGISYAGGITASRSTHKVKVDGENIALNGYYIDGHNYYMLADVGEAVGFDVTWNGESQTVEITTGERTKADSPLQAELPAEETRTFTVEGKKYVFKRNLDETKRMLDTLNRAFINNEETWKDGQPVLFQSGKPKVTVSLKLSSEEGVQVFWPWRESEITKLFNSCPPGHYEMEAWDVWCDGIFQRTEYNIAVR